MVARRGGVGEAVRLPRPSHSCRVDGDSPAPGAAMAGAGWCLGAGQQGPHFGPWDGPGIGIFFSTAPLLPELANNRPLWPREIHTLSEPLSHALAPQPSLCWGRHPPGLPRSPGTASCSSTHFLHCPHPSSQLGLFMSATLTSVLPGQWGSCSVAGTIFRANDLLKSNPLQRKEKPENLILAPSWGLALPFSWRGASHLLPLQKQTCRLLVLTHPFTSPQKDF